MGTASCDHEDCTCISCARCGESIPEDTGVVIKAGSYQVGPEEWIYQIEHLCDRCHFEATQILTRQDDSEEIPS